MRAAALEDVLVQTQYRKRCSDSQTSCCYSGSVAKCVGLIYSSKMPEKGKQNKARVDE